MALTLIGLFFSYRILDVPSGLTIDEAAFGYNAILLSQTLHDQNGRFLPVFVLSIDGKDWRQPITQYYLTTLFKIFGPSILNLRLSTVLILILSCIFIFYLTTKLINLKMAVVSTVLFLTTPLVMIQSHLALDNIMPIPFTLVWLISLTLFHQKPNSKYLVLAAFSLGLSFYSYKGMRATVPVWAILTTFYLSWDYLSHRTKPTLAKFLKDALIFSLSILPFFAVIPLLESKYPGAIFDKQQPSIDSIYAFLYPYFSSFDLSFLYIRGDELIFHSTLKHGMFLLTTLPLFIFGLYLAIKVNKLWWLIILAFLTAPVLYGLVNSVHRASRLMTLIPPYILICTLAAQWLIQHLKDTKVRLLTICLICFLAINYLDFINYYWFSYPQDSRYAFGDLTKYQAFEALSEQAKLTSRTPYVSRRLMAAEGESAKFYQRIYFKDHINLFEDNQQIPAEPFILLSEHGQVNDLHNLDLSLPYYHLFTN